MRPNPGGQIDPGSIIGRDELIATYWEILEGRGIYLNDLRRIGKTQIMVKMHSDPPAGWRSVKRDMEGCHTADEFTAQVFRDAWPHLGIGDKAKRSVAKLLGWAAGMEVAGVLKLPDGTIAPWKEVLGRTFRDLNEAMEEEGALLVFFWDEIPYLIDNIARKEGPETAMELLDMLRSLSQDFNRVRLFLTGSIGIHHVLTRLKMQGYSNSALNHMEHARPGPLGPVHALHLATELIHGAGLTVADHSDHDACATLIAESTGGVAFYIHKLVSKLSRASALDPVLIAAVLEKEIASDQNDWDFQHYLDRLSYYGDRRKMALGVLDTVAASPAIDFKGIRNALAAQGDVDEEVLRDLLKHLCMDHYLVRGVANQYRFYLELVRRWWSFNRNL